MSTIVPRIDAYGTYARSAALADVLEVQALSATSASVAELADYIGDNRWARGLRDPFVGVPERNDEDGEEFEDLGQEADANEMAARDVFALLAERSAILGNRYPFVLEGQRLHSYGLDDAARLSYLLLLAITVAHAYGIDDQGFNPRNLFEELVTASFRSRGLLASDLGEFRRAMSLEEALDRVGEECRLMPNLADAVVRRRAQEEGVDVVAHLDWADSRPMHWVYIVQATCARSDFWKQKLSEPSPLMWKNIFGLLVHPAAVLAVPHHMPRAVMHYLLQHGRADRFIMDRLRLANVELELVPSAQQLLAFVEGVDVDFR